MTVDLEDIRRRVARVLADVRAPFHGADASATPYDAQAEVERLVGQDVPAMLDEIETLRATVGICVVLQGAVKQLMSDASLLSAYMEGVTKNGAGSKEAVGNMTVAVAASLRTISQILRSLEDVRRLREQASRSER